MLENVEDAIENNNIQAVIELLELYKTEIHDITDYLYLAVEDGYWDIAKVLLPYGTINYNYNTSEYITVVNELLSWEEPDFELLSFLLKDGSNPNYYDADNKESQLHRRVDGRFFDTKNGFYNITKLLLQYGSQVYLNSKAGLCNCSVLSSVLSYSNDYRMIQLLLDYGADPAIPDEYGDSMQSVLSRHKEKYSQEDYIKVEKLLNPNNPPFLKLGEDKYIIYENKFFEALSRGIVPYTDAQPYLLANKQKHPDKKYLYADNKIDAFVYWCYTKGLLLDSVLPTIKTYIEKHDMSQYKNMNLFLKSTLGDILTTEYFTEEGKNFATAYLTVTHWWYNLHTDFNRLYQEDGIKLPRAIKSQEEFDTLIKLLDIRHEQFKSGKDFNSNQNKEELEALIEGREPPKRVVDLSFLEEDEETDNTPSNTNTLPEDFMK